MNDNPDFVPVVIVGAGPTGITAATKLAQYGVDCLVLDRWEDVYPQPRAVHLDDEIYRLLAGLGIGGEFAAISRPARGLQLGHVAVQVEPVQAGDVQHHVPGHYVRGRHHRRPGHPPARPQGKHDLLRH